jgi:hypothetical protein
MQFFIFHQTLLNPHSEANSIFHEFQFVGPCKNCSLEKSACPEHQVVSGFSYGGQKVKGRKYPWIGAVLRQGQVICGSNLS